MLEKQRKLANDDGGRQMKSIAWGTTIAAALAATPPAHAHHSTAAFDTKQQIAVEGTLVRYEWINPHVFLWVEGKDDSGNVVTWEVEGSPPAFLARQGLTPDVLEIGSRVKVNGNPGRDPKRGLVLMSTLETGGSTLALGQRGAIVTIVKERPPATARAEGLQGTWATALDLDADALFYDPSKLALTEKAKAAVASYEEAESVGCAPSPSPGDMLAPDIKSIEVRDDVVVLRRGWDDAERTIHLNTATHDGAAPSRLGHSIGRWEGNTFVIDTARFTPDAHGNTNRVPSGPQKHVVERLTLADDGTHLTYSLRLEDPEYLAEPIEVTGGEWAYRPDLKYEPLGCDAENARRGFE
jgi:Family of unknown function (DUF6152)